MRRKIHRYDAILILGVELGRRDEPTPELRRRIAEAAQAYHEGLAEVVVACGGVLPGHARAEAEVICEGAVRCRRAGKRSQIGKPVAKHDGEFSLCGADAARRPARAGGDQRLPRVQGGGDGAPGGPSRSRKRRETCARRGLVQLPAQGGMLHA